MRHEEPRVVKCAGARALVFEQGERKIRDDEILMER